MGLQSNRHTRVSGHTPDRVVSVTPPVCVCVRTGTLCGWRCIDNDPPVLSPLSLRSLRLSLFFFFQSDTEEGQEVVGDT
jgi:hypothetical protein